MKIAWIIQGVPKYSWSYFVQIRLFSIYLDKLGHTCQVFNITDINQDLPNLKISINIFNPDVLINIGDIHFPQLAKLLNIPLVSIVTNGTGQVDINKPFPLVTFACTTHYAQKLYQQSGTSPTPYFPHGFNPDIFYPNSRQKARQSLGWTHKNPTILMLGTNYPVDPNQFSYDPTIDRKNWIGGLKAFAHFHKSRPEVKLYLHTNSYGAVNIPYWINKLSIKNSVLLADKSTNQLSSLTSAINNTSQSHLANLYCASDIFLFPSLGESFGVPIIEAQACGIPVIATTAGPIPELIFTGKVVKSTPHPAYPGWAIPNHKSLSRAMTNG